MSAAVVVVAFVAFVVCCLFQNKHWVYTRINHKMTGVDISAHTGKVDFDAIPKEDVLFIYMKATEGIDFVDSMMERNYDSARTCTQIPIGFYHFFRFDDDGAHQAEFFYQQIKDKFYQLMPVLDVEDWSNSKKNNTKTRVEQIAAFIDRFESLSGNRVMIYTNKDGYNKYVKGHFDNSPLWICSLKMQDDVVCPHLFWQYKHKGRFQWAEGEVDLNMFTGSPADFSLMTSLKSSINHLPEVTKAADVNMVCDTTDGLNIYYPQFDRIDLACARMPSPNDSSVIFCAEAAFTGVESKLFKHSNIAGNHVSRGTFFKGYSCKTNTGCFLWYDNRAQFIMGDGANALQTAARRGGMGFCQVMIIHKAVKLPLWRKNDNYYRALCLKDGKLCIVDSKDKIPYQRFVDYLMDYGVEEAMYLDMGPGWNHSWYRDNFGQMQELFPHVHDFTTNWITFYK